MSFPRAKIEAQVTQCRKCQNAAHGVFKILYLHSFMNDCELDGLPQSGLAANRIYHGDCLKGMKLLLDRSVDMILCDPPYGVTANAWDSIINMDRLWSEYKRIIKPKGAIVLTARCPLPHQRIAVYENLIPQSPLRFMLADDAGAGKTIMTGLYILEMLNRGRFKRVLICCPAGLVFNWQRELRFFFELNFTILRGSDFRDRDPLAESDLPFVIISVDTAATPALREKLANRDTPAFDLAVFDEAHKLSWSDPNRKDSKTLRYQLAEVLSRRVPNLLLLTATPHMGKGYPYFALWRLLDSAVFSTPDAIESLPEQKRERHFLRRLKEEMITYDGEPIYKPRLAQTIPVSLTPEETKFYDAATEYIQWSYENNKSLNRNAAAMVVAILQRRLASRPLR
jgi:SNF2 family DNA or RNA helicase